MFDKVLQLLTLLNWWHHLCPSKLWPYPLLLLLLLQWLLWLSDSRRSIELLLLFNGRWLAVILIAEARHMRCCDHALLVRRGLLTLIYGQSLLLSHRRHLLSWRLLSLVITWLRVVSLLSGRLVLLIRSVWLLLLLRGLIHVIVWLLLLLSWLHLRLCLVLLWLRWLLFLGTWWNLSWSILVLLLLLLVVGRLSEWGCSMKLRRVLYVLLVLARTLKVNIRLVRLLWGLLHHLRREFGLRVCHHHLLLLWLLLVLLRREVRGERSLILTWHRLRLSLVLRLMMSSLKHVIWRMLPKQLIMIRSLMMIIPSGEHKIRVLAFVNIWLVVPIIIATRLIPGTVLHTVIGSRKLVLMILDIGGWHHLRVVRGVELRAFHLRILQRVVGVHLRGVLPEYLGGLQVLRVESLGIWHLIVLLVHFCAIEFIILNYNLSTARAFYRSWKINYPIKFQFKINSLLLI